MSGHPGQQWGLNYLLGSSAVVFRKYFYLKKKHVLKSLIIFEKSRTCSCVVYASNELSKSGTSAKVFSGNVIQEVDKNSGCNEVLQKNTTDDVRRRLISEKRIMFEKSNIKVGDVVEMIMGLAYRYSLVYSLVLRDVTLILNHRLVRSIW